jgi:hypothetical protein
MVDAKQQKGTPSLAVGFTAVTYSSIPEEEKKELAAKEKAKDKSKEPGKETDKSKAKDKKA